MSMKLIQEVIEYGSVFEALKKGVVTISEILEYLLKSDVTDNTLIAYKAVCEQEKTEIDGKYNRKQYVNGNPFLLENIDERYILIYLLYFGNKTLEDWDSKYKHDIAIKICDYIPLLSSNENEMIKLKIISEDPNIKYVYPKYHSLLIKARSKRFDKKIHSYTYYVNSDNIEPLKEKELKLYGDIILKRGYYLKEKAPLYWEKIGYELYYNFLKEKFNTSSNPNSDSDSDSDSDSKNKPKITKHDEIINMSNLLYNLKLCSKYTQCYALGFPINHHIPSDEIIQKSFKILDQKGINKYIKIISEKNRSYFENLKQHIGNISNNNFNDGNLSSAIGDCIYDYNLFDIVTHFDKNHVYYFTREEFETILKNSKNIWTQKTLPSSVICEIESRQTLSEDYNLPKSESLFEILTNIENGKLFELDFKTEQYKSNNDIEFLGQILNNRINNLQFDNNTSFNLIYSEFFDSIVDN